MIEWYIFSSRIGFHWIKFLLFASLNYFAPPQLDLRPRSSRGTYCNCIFFFFQNGSYAPTSASKWCIQPWFYCVILKYLTTQEHSKFQVLLHSTIFPCHMFSQPLIRHLASVGGWRNPYCRFWARWLSDISSALGLDFTELNFCYSQVLITLLLLNLICGLAVPEVPTAKKVLLSYVFAAFDQASCFL
jgi:hypothetical protein